MRDRPIEYISTWQYTPITSDRHPCPRRDSNPQSQKASGGKSAPLDSSATGIGHYKFRHCENNRNSLLDSFLYLLNTCRFFNISVFIPFSYPIYSFVPSCYLCLFRCFCVLCHFISYCFSTLSHYQWTCTSLHIADVITKPSRQIPGRKTSYLCWGLYGLFQSLQANASDYVSTVPFHVITNSFLTNHSTIRRCVFSDTFNKQRSCGHLGRQIAQKLKLNVARLTYDIVHHYLHPEIYGGILGHVSASVVQKFSETCSYVHGLVGVYSVSVSLPLSLCPCLSVSVSLCLSVCLSLSLSLSLWILST